MSQRPCCIGWRRSRPDLSYCPACAQSEANDQAQANRRAAKLLPIPPRPATDVPGYAILAATFGLVLLGTWPRKARRRHRDTIWRCKRCGARFVATERSRYCSEDCRSAARLDAR